MGQHVPQAMWREEGQTSVFECGLKDFADPCSAGPELPADTGGKEAFIVIKADRSFGEIGYSLRSPIRSRSVLKTNKKTPMYGLISTHSYRTGNKGKFHNHASEVDTLFGEKWVIVAE